MSEPSSVTTAFEMSDAEAEEFRSLCMAIGFVVVNWAVIEQQIDYQVNLAFKDCGGKRLRKSQDIPRSFKQKARFLRDCFKKLRSLKRFAGEGLSLIGRAENLAEERHSLVHAAVTSTLATQGIFNFKKVGYHTEDHSVTPFTFGPDDFSKLESGLGDLLTDLIRFAEKLADEFL